MKEAFAVVVERTALHDRFVARFHFGDPPAPASAQTLDVVEAELNTRLPEAYRRFMICHGVIHTPGILDALCAGQVDHPDVQDFLAPQQVVDNTKGYWSAGMPRDIIGFASDCMGNLLGFRHQSVVADDGAVVFFDHDYRKVRELSDSFDGFLRWYLDNL